LNFSTKKVECPAILNYDEIKSALILDFCLSSKNIVSVQAKDKLGIINASYLELTLNTQEYKLSINETIDIPLNQSETLYTKLIYSDECYKSNSGEVAYFIDWKELSSCSDGDNFKMDEKPSPKVIEESVEAIKTKKKAELIKKKTIAPTKKQTPKLTKDSNVKKKEQATGTKNTIAKISYSDNIIKEETRNKESQAKPVPLAHKPVVSSQYTKTKKYETKTINKREQQKQVTIASNKSLKAEENVSIKQNAESTLRPELAKSNISNSLVEIENVSTDLDKTNTATVVKTTPIITGSLFSTQYTGIKRKCPSSENSKVSDTDLLALSLKSNSKIKLYDVYCHAVSNSKVIITLTHTGKVISSFTQYLNIGENQISLSALGNLEKDISYIIEFKTENKADLFMFPLCAKDQHPNQDVKLNYLDDAYAFYGITYDKE